MSRTPTKKSIIASLQPGEVKTFTFAKGEKSECDSYSAVAWRYSINEGEAEGKYVHACISYPRRTIHLVCTTWDEYIKESQGELPKKWWKCYIHEKKTTTKFSRHNSKR